MDPMPRTQSAPPQPPPEPPLRRPGRLPRRSPAWKDRAVTSWRPGWDDFPQALLDFWTERHLCTLTTLREDGRPHVVPVGVALDLEQRCAWVITGRESRKARN